MYWNGTLRETQRTITSLVVLDLRTRDRRYSGDTKQGKLQLKVLQYKIGVRSHVNEDRAPVTLHVG